MGGRHALRKRFPVAITLNDPRNEDALRRVIGDPLWKTIRRLELGPGFGLPTELLQHPVMRSLEHLGAYDTAPILELLAWKRVPYTSLGLDGEFSRSAADQRAFLAGAGKLRRLREIAFSGQRFDRPTSARWLVDSALGKGSRGSPSPDGAPPSPTGSPSSRAQRRRRFASFIRARTEARSRCRATGRVGSIARARIGGYLDSAKTDADSLSYAQLAELLAPLSPDALSKLEIVGRPPTANERKRLLAALPHLGAAIFLPTG